MAAFISPQPILQFFDNNGDPLAGGLLYTYIASTTTPLATYTDSTGVTANTNPIVLNSRGEASVWLAANTYKFALYTSASVLIWTINNISGGAGSGTVTSVTSANADATVATTTTTPVITLVQTPALKSATTTVNVSASAAPTTGQILTATSSTSATWQTSPSGSLYGETNSTSPYETSLGYQAGNVNIGLYNTFVGYQTGIANDTGTSNTFVGYQAGLVNSTGGYNTSVGYKSLIALTTGSNNTAIGNGSLLTNTFGYNNTAIGSLAINLNTFGYGNTACGYNSLSANISGNNNIAIGFNTLMSNTTGKANTGCGYQALMNNTTGSGNTAINPSTDTSTYTPVFDPTTQNNRFCMGSTSVTNAYIQVAWTVVSDARDKIDFAPVPHGLDFVNKLKPTAYRYTMSRGDTVGHGPIRYGFKAQDVLALEGNTPVIVDAEDAEKLRFNDQSMIAVLVNALQELNAKFDAYVSTHP